MHVVTGASSRIGRGVTRALAERGETVLAVAPALLAEGPVERLTVFDSYSANTPQEGWSAYSVMKAAAQMSARAAAELPGTAVVRIFPGAVETPLLCSVLEDGSGVSAIGFYRRVGETVSMAKALLMSSFWRSSSAKRASRHSSLVPMSGIVTSPHQVDVPVSR